MKNKLSKYLYVLISGIALPEAISAQIEIRDQGERHETSEYAKEKETLKAKQAKEKEQLEKQLAIMHKTTANPKTDKQRSNIAQQVIRDNIGIDLGSNPNATRDNLQKKHDKESKKLDEKHGVTKEQDRKKELDNTFNTALASADSSLETNPEAISTDLTTISDSLDSISFEQAQTNAETAIDKLPETAENKALKKEIKDATTKEDLKKAISKEKAAYEKKRAREKAKSGKAQDKLMFDKEQANKKEKAQDALEKQNAEKRAQQEKAREAARRRKNEKQEARSNHAEESKAEELATDLKNIFDDAIDHSDVAAPKTTAAAQLPKAEAKEIQSTAVMATEITNFVKAHEQILSPAAKADASKVEEITQELEELNPDSSQAKSLLTKLRERLSQLFEQLSLNVTLMREATQKKLNEITEKYHNLFTIKRPATPDLAQEPLEQQSSIRK